MRERELDKDNLLQIRELVLEKMHVSAARVLDLRVESQRRYIDLAEELVISLTGFVLKEQAGPVVRTTHLEHVVNFPRWFPSWLVRRLSKTVTVTLNVTPLYTYPESTLVVPTLGRAIKFSCVEPLNISEEQPSPQPLPPHPTDPVR